jgi:hypothetical protein
MPFPLIAIGLAKAAPFITTGLTHLFGHDPILKRAKSADEVLAGWKHPIPDNYVPAFSPQKNEWDFTFSLGAKGGRPSTSLDPNVARSQDEVLQWQSAGIPVTCDANGICSRTDGGGQSAAPTGVPDAGAGAVTSQQPGGTGVLAQASAAVEQKAGGQPLWLWIVLGLGLVFIFKR